MGNDHLPTATSQAPATRFWQKIGLIAEISAACRGQQPDAPSFGEVLELIQGIIPFDAATLYLKDSGSQALTPRAQLVEEVPLPGILLASGEPGGGQWPTSLRKPVLWSDEPDENEFESGGGYAATLSVPLLIDDGVIGVLNLGSYVDRVLTERQIPLMMIVADQLAVSVERLNQMAEIQAQNEALHKAHRQLKANQERIIAAEKIAALVELAATVNHEINNPLSVIIGQVQCLALEEPGLSDKAVGRLHRVERASVRIAEVNRRLLRIDSAFSGKRVNSPEDGKRDLQKCPQN